MEIVPIPKRPLERKGLVAAEASHVSQVFGWPCRLTVVLDTGELAFLLDSARSSPAPRELLTMTEDIASASFRAQTSVWVSIIPVFRRLIILKMSSREDPRAVASGSVDVVHETT